MTIAVVLALAFSACVVSPQPEPPGLDGIGQAEGALFARAGTVDPPEGDVWLVALAQPTPPVIVPVLADGSFAPVPWMVERGLTRAQVRVGAARSTPIDFRVSPGVGTVSPLVPQIPCIAAAAEFDFGEVRADTPTTLDVVLQSTCPDDTTVRSDNTGLRIGALGYALGTPPPYVVPAMGELRIPVTLNPGGTTGVIEDVLVLDLQTPAMDVDVRYVSLIGLGI